MKGNVLEYGSYPGETSQPVTDVWREKYFIEKDREKDRLLFLIKENDEKTLRYFTDDIKNWRNDKGCNLLHIAAENNDAQLINKLIALGVDKNLKASIDLGLPLDFAVENCNLEAIGAFITHGDSINVEGFSAIEAAAYHNEPELIDFIVKKGFDINTKNSDGRTVLHVVAIQWDVPEVIKALLKSGADVKARDTNGETPLHLSVKEYCDEDSIKALIAAGSDVNMQNNSGETALHEVISNYDDQIEEIMYIIIAAGTNVNIQDKNGNTALHCILSSNSPSRIECIENMVKAFIAAGADLTIKNNDGKTALDIAEENNEKSVIDLLYKHSPHDEVEEEKEENVIKLLSQPRPHDEVEKNSVKRVKVENLPDDEIYFVSPLQNILNRVEEKKKGLEK